MDVKKSDTGTDSTQILAQSLACGNVIHFLVGTQVTRSQPQDTGTYKVGTKLD